MIIRYIIFALTLLASCTAKKDKATSAISGGAVLDKLIISGTIQGGNYDSAVVFNVGGATLSGTGAAENPLIPVDAGQLSVTIDRATGAGLLGDTEEETGATSTNVIMVMENQDDPLDAFETMTFISAPTESSDNLINIASESATTDSIDLGTITQTDSDLVGSTVLGTEQFDIAKNIIAEMAKVDDALRVLKNQFANVADTGSIKGVQEFYWNGNIRDMIDQDADPAKLEFAGWSPALHVDRSDISFASLCDTSASDFKTMELVVPSPGVKRLPTDTSYVTSITNAGAVLDSGGNSCGAGANSSNTFIKRGSSSSTTLYMNFGGGSPFQTDIPEGTWKLKLNDTVTAKFDLALSFPLVEESTGSTTRVPRVYVPSLKVTTDPTTHVITQVELWFYVYDSATKAYTKVTDYTVMKQTISSSWFNFETSGPSPVQDGLSSEASYSWPDNGQAKLLKDFTQTWKLKSTDYKNCPDPSGALRPGLFNVQYIMYDNRYSFTYSLPTAANISTDCL